jgi:hypothetical protein
MKTSGIDRLSARRTGRGSGNSVAALSRGACVLGRPLARFENSISAALLRSCPPTFATRGRSKARCGWFRGSGYPATERPIALNRASGLRCSQRDEPEASDPCQRPLHPALLGILDAVVAGNRREGFLLVIICAVKTYAHRCGWTRHGAKGLIPKVASSNMLQIPFLFRIRMKRHANPGRVGDGIEEMAQMWMGCEPCKP